MTAFAPRLATYSINGSTMYGAVASSGLVDLSARFAKDYPTLRDVIAAGALMKLAEEAERYSPDAPFDAITWQPPIPAPEKIICIGVNYPDRNASASAISSTTSRPSPRSYPGTSSSRARRPAPARGSIRRATSNLATSSRSKPTASACYAMPSSTKPRKD